MPAGAKGAVRRGGGVVSGVQRASFGTKNSTFLKGVGTKPEGGGVSIYPSPTIYNNFQHLCTPTTILDKTLDIYIIFL